MAYGSCVATWSRWSQFVAAEDKTVVSEIGGGPIDEADWVSEILTTSKDVADALEVVPRTLVLANTYTWRLKGGEPVESGTISYRVDRCRFKHEARFSQPNI